MWETKEKLKCLTVGKITSFRQILLQISLHVKKNTLQSEILALWKLTSSITRGNQFGPTLAQGRLWHHVKKSLTPDSCNLKKIYMHARQRCFCCCCFFVFQVSWLDFFGGWREHRNLIWSILFSIVRQLSSQWGFWLCWCNWIELKCLKTHFFAYYNKICPWCGVMLISLKETFVFVLVFYTLLM